MKKLWLGSFVLACTMGGAAMAADMAVKARPYAPAFSWTGCYIGVEGGWAGGRSKHVGTAAPGFGTVGDFTPWFSLSGGLAGGEIGCNATIGNSIWVMGAESDISWTNKKGSSFDTGIAGDPTLRSETRERWISTSRVRIGPTWDRLWGYVTGGFAAARVEARVTNPFGLQFSDTHTLYGWTGGLGLEYAWWDFWSIKVEYLYARFENQGYFLIPPAGAVPRGALNVDDHIVRVGLNWRWGGLGKAPVVAAY
jgi:outer membrane immunogenic protein